MNNAVVNNLALSTLTKEDLPSNWILGTKNTLLGAAENLTKLGKLNL